mgnify:CR=1 FL=1
MSAQEFYKIADLTFRSDNKLTRKAVKMVVIDGMTQTVAAKAVGVTLSAVSAAVGRFRRTAEIFSR